MASCDGWALGMECGDDSTGDVQRDVLVMDDMAVQSRRIDLDHVRSRRRVPLRDRRTAIGEQGETREQN